MSDESRAFCFRLITYHSSLITSEAMDGQQRIPILKVGRVLIVPIQVDMDDQTVMHLQERILTELERTGASGVLIDISLLEMVDSFIGRVLSDIAAMARIMDARTVVVGMQPAVAITLVELGLELRGVDTVLNVDEGIRLLRSEFAMDEDEETVEYGGPASLAEQVNRP
ncbi:MAG TPA: STAS domain-containing protein [Pyrinomonadaceae bacterium]|nr:STAS domain-containing protein [Pyrinomonadaceae bacterium]